ncbi:hypothetical protein CEW46_27670 [Bacillus cereus]|nr:hypothetical protein CEW46_27670 [Bacillus cereus]
MKVNYRLIHTETDEVHTWTSGTSRKELQESEDKARQLITSQLSYSQHGDWVLEVDTDEDHVIAQLVRELMAKGISKLPSFSAKSAVLITKEEQ